MSCTMCMVVSVIFSMHHLSAEYRVTVNGIGQHKGQDNYGPPEHKAQRFILGGGFLDGDAGRNDVGIEGCNEAKIAGEEKTDAV